MATLSHSQGLLRQVLDQAAVWAHLFSVWKKFPYSESGGGLYLNSSERVRTLLEHEGVIDCETPRSPALLLRLMGQLDLEPGRVRERHPTVMRQLERTCAGCRQQDRCKRDLALGCARATYGDFCPSSKRFDALRKEAA